MATGFAPTSAGTTDEIAIRALFDQLATGWNAGDGDAYGALFTDDADYVTFDGTQLRGGAAIAESHRDLFAAFLKGSTLAAQITDLRFLAPDVAVAHGIGAVRLRWQAKASASRQSIQTYVAVRQGATWQFAAFQNTRVRSFERTALGKILSLARRLMRRGTPR